MYCICMGKVVYVLGHFLVAFAISQSKTLITTALLQLGKPLSGLHNIVVDSA